MLLGIVVDGVFGVGIVAPDTERALQQRPRHLARPKAGDLRSLREVANGLIYLAAHLVGGELDLQHHGAVLRGPRGHLHLPRFGIDHRKTRV